mmetsp:Transcript_12860/g.16046  ORF Transcript_12860/g.16046 Transcript_12860/m.16046 type:complete len:80 (+) Transcript_12860:762-1001(+)
MIKRAWSPNTSDRPQIRDFLTLMEDAEDPPVQNCSVCNEEPCTHVLMPCGHLCVCEVCPNGLESCPLCGSVPKAFHKVL